MDASLGDRQRSVWRSASDEQNNKKKKTKKESKKPHWLVAKEHGKRKNGSEKRRSRQSAFGETAKKTSAPSTAELQQAPARKKGKVEREEAASLSSQSASEQRSFLVRQLRSALSSSEWREPPESAFCAALQGASFAARVQEACGEELWKSVAATAQETSAQLQRRTCRVLVLSIGAVRCVELIQQLRPPLGPEAAPVCKLWSKHMDIEEQKRYLATHFVGVAVGTPNRICKLIQDESLTLSNTALIVIDCQPNAKMQTIFTLPETAVDLYAFLAVCLKRLAKGKLKIAFC